jgi:acyl transferase domain-containing protein
VQRDANHVSKPPDRTIRVRCSQVRLCANNGPEQVQQGACTEAVEQLLNQLVGECEQTHGYLYPKRLGSLEVDHKLETVRRSIGSSAGLAPLMILSLQ